jgi:LysM repeat protein
VHNEPDRPGRPARATGLPGPRLGRHGGSWRRSVSARLGALVAAAVVAATGVFALFRARATTDGASGPPVGTAVLAAAPAEPVPPTQTPLMQATPTAEPTRAPTAEPTEPPTAQPTDRPTAPPTEPPTAEPAQLPTVEPTQPPRAATPTTEPAPAAQVVPPPPPPPPPPRQQPRPAYRTYVVQRGDVLKQIAARYGVSVASILAINTIPNPDSLRIGQVLTIPPAGS